MTRPTHAYEVVIYWSDEDGRFLAQVPELPGCVAVGLSYVEVADAVWVAIQEWVDAARCAELPVPLPRGRPCYTPVVVTPAAAPPPGDDRERR